MQIAYNLMQWRKRVTFRRILRLLSELVSKQVTAQSQRLSRSSIFLGCRVARLKEQEFRRAPRKRFVLTFYPLQASQSSIRANEGPAHTATGSEPSSDTAESYNQIARSPIRTSLTEYLPREPEVHPPLCSCPDCGVVCSKSAAMVAIRDPRGRPPTHFNVIRHGASKYSRAPQCDTVVSPTGAAAGSPIPNSMSRESSAFVSVLIFAIHPSVLT